MLAVALLSVAAARVEAIALTTAGSRPALRVSLSGRPGAVALRRERETARLVIAGAELGPSFAGAHRVSWAAGERALPAWLSGSRASGARRIDVGEGSDLVYVVLRAPRLASAELQQDAHGLLVVFSRSASADDKTAALTAASPTRAPAPAPPASPQAGAAEPAAPDEPAEGGGSVAELYPRLFPSPTGTEAAPAPVAAPARGEAATLGPFRLRASVEARYVDADTYLGSAQPVHDRFAELSPRAGLELPVAAGQLAVDYRPVLRALASYDQINSNSHHVHAELDLPLGERLRLRANDRFVTGTLDTRVVDPGGEYFFDLGRFRRNDADLALSILVGPRTSLELGGAVADVHFLQQSSFFDYASRRGSLGVGFEITPNLRAVASYSYDTVPRASQRPQAESHAHAANLALNGELLPLLSGELGLGYRSQHNPSAGAGGERYTGVTFSGALTRQLAPESTLSLYLTRALPVSAYQENGFYVWTAVQAALQLPLPLALQLRFGLGQQWNDYRVAAAGASLREDRIFSWYLALRRALRGKLSLSGSYRSERRRSNVADFESDSGGLLLQLEWQALGGPSR
jgi:hypothetical protein